MPAMNMVQAINLALRQEMTKDPDVIILGEDVGKNGGVFRVTEGLWQQYGDSRVVDTPLAESAIVGVSIGLSVYGMRPVAEIQFDGFSFLAFNQLINHAARIRTRSRGRFHAPLVVRIPYGGGIRALEHHSDSPEAYFCHAPGLKVIVPSTPYEAKGLLVSSIRDPDPVIFLEPKRVYRAIKEDVPEDEYTIPLSKCNIIQEGSDITLISWGSMLRTCKEAIAQSKYSIELIDVRTLSPFDTETILRSVQKTGRVVIVQEAQRTCSFASELAALIAEKALLYLKAPVKRITGYDIVMPLPKLENYYLPNAEKINKSIEEAMRF